MNNPQCDSTRCKFISWHAIVAGSLVALGLTFLFNLLTIGLGLSMFTRNEQGMQVLTFAGFAWVLIGIYVLLFLAGWVTGRLVHRDYSLHCCNGMVHGFIMWSVYLILSILILSHMTETSVVLLKSTFSSITPDTAVASANATQVNVAASPTPHEVHKIGLSTLGTFLVFLAGAFGACVGAFYGIRESKKCLDKPANTPVQGNDMNRMNR